MTSVETIQLLGFGLGPTLLNVSMADIDTVPELGLLGLGIPLLSVWISSVGAIQRAWPALVFVGA